MKRRYMVVQSSAPRPRKRSVVAVRIEDMDTLPAEVYNVSVVNAQNKVEAIRLYREHVLFQTPCRCKIAAPTS